MTARLRTDIRRSTRRTDPLARELSEFRTRAELAELAALLDRHADTETAPLRDLISWTTAA